MIHRERKVMKALVIFCIYLLIFISLLNKALMNVDPIKIVTVYCRKESYNNW